MRHSRFEHQFVEQLPEQLQQGMLYISIKYATSAHLCGCGCGEEVITPFSPTDWEMIFDGETVSLYPSIGNWNFACRSHYFIRRGQLVEAASWSNEQVIAGRRQDKVAKEKYYHGRETISPIRPSPEPMNQKEHKGVSFIVNFYRSVNKLWKKLRP